MVKTTKKETLTHLGKNFWNHLHLHSPLKNPDEDTRRSRGKKEALHALNTRLNPHERNTEREERKRYKKQKTFSFFFFWVSGHQRTVMSVFITENHSDTVGIFNLSLSFCFQPRNWSFLFSSPLLSQIPCCFVSAITNFSPFFPPALLTSSPYLTPICSKPKLLPFLFVDEVSRYHAKDSPSRMCICEDIYI